MFRELLICLAAGIFLTFAIGAYAEAADSDSAGEAALDSFRAGFVHGLLRYLSRKRR